MKYEIVKMSKPVKKAKYKELYKILDMMQIGESIIVSDGLERKAALMYGKRINGHEYITGRINDNEYQVFRES